MLRVDVFNDGKASNTYLFDKDHGAVAIIMKNPGNKDIPESIFLVTTDKGLYAPADDQ